MSNRKRKSGYGNPPKDSQFKKGKSGNPGGRPKGSTSLAAALRAEGDALITLTVNGKPVRRTKREFAAHLAWTEALKGNFKFLALIHKVEGDQPAEDPTEDREIEVKLILEEEPAWATEGRIQFEKDYPNFDPNRPSSEWGPTDPEGEQGSTDPEEPAGEEGSTDPDEEDPDDPDSAH